MTRIGRLLYFYLLPYYFISPITVSANEISTILFSLLFVLGATFGALNLHLYLKQRTIVKELKSENELLKLKLIDCDRRSKK